MPSTPHFEGGVTGSRGSQRRQGTQKSGMSAFTQSASSRLGITMHYNATADQDDATIMIGPGVHRGGETRYINLPDINTIIAALDSGDPKIMKIWTRIQNEFDKLADAAHPAMLRAESRREREAKSQERNRRRHAVERDLIIRRLDGAAKLALHKLCDVEWDAAGMPVSTTPFGPDEGNLRLDHDGETPMIDARMPMGKAWHVFPFDLSTCEWVLSDTPDFFSLEDTIEKSGYGWRVEST